MTNRFNYSFSSIHLVAIGASFGACLGIAIGMVIGVNANQFGWGLVDDAVCINGVAYKPYDGEIGSPWNGIYKPIEQGQPAIYDEDGREILQQVIPVPCKVSRG